MKKRIFSFMMVLLMLCSLLSVNALALSNFDTISEGTYDEDVQNHGIISGGTFTSTVENFDSITGGTFNGNVHNSAQIKSGTFTGDVQNSRDIYSGTFNGPVINTGNIYDGNFTEEVTNSGTVFGGSFAKLTDNGGQYPLNLTCSPSAGGTVKFVEGTNTGKVGDVISISATAADGYLFKNWTATCNVTGVTVAIADANAATTTITVPASPVTLTANFERGYDVGAVGIYSMLNVPSGETVKLVGSGTVYGFSVSSGAVLDATEAGWITIMGSSRNSGTIIGAGISGQLTNFGTLIDVTVGGVMSNAGGTIESGTFGGEVENDGTIKDGSFTGTVENGGTIKDGDFTGTVTNSGEIHTGSFSGDVTNTGVIMAGDFTGTVTNSGLIQSGSFTKIIDNGGTYGLVVLPGSVDGCSIIADASAYAAGATVTLTATVKDGYALKSWKMTPELTNDGARSDGTAPTTMTFAMPAYPLTVAGEFVKVHTVTYVANGQTVDTKTVVDGEDVSDVPVVPDKEGHHSGAWNHDGKNITADTTIEATYTPNTYTVTYEADSKTVDTRTVNWGGTVSNAPAVPAKTGYTGNWEAEASNVKANITVKAVYTANTYKVKFNVNGGTSSHSDITVTYGQTYGTLPTATHSSLYFAGWYTAQTGGTRVYGSTAVTTAADHTLYAHWSSVPVTGDDTPVFLWTALLLTSGTAALLLLRKRRQEP